MPLSPSSRRPASATGRAFAPAAAGLAGLVALTIWTAGAAAQGVDFMELFNDANRGAIEQGRTTNLNSALGGAQASAWPPIDETALARHVFTMGELKAMVTSDRQRARALLEGQVITVRGVADEPNRWGTWVYLKDPAVKYAAKGEWRAPIAQPAAGSAVSLRGRVAKLQASTIYLEEPQLLP